MHAGPGNHDRKAKAHFDRPFNPNVLSPYDRGHQVQHAISNRLRSASRGVVLVLHPSTREHGWVECLRSKDAGLWLSRAPKTSIHTLPDQHFEVSISLRIFTSPKELSWECEVITRQEKLSTSISNVSTTAQILEAESTHNYDRVRGSIAKILNCAGTFTKLENTVVFKKSAPDS